MAESSARRFESMISALRSQGMSCGAIAAASAISRTTVWRATVGECPRPSAEIFFRIEKVWRAKGCPVSGK